MVKANKEGQRKAPILRFKGFTDDWEQRKLGEKNTITMGQSPSSKNYTDNPNDWILIQGNADLKDGKVSPRIYTSQITKKADIGDIILTVRAPVGEVAITDYNAVLGRGVAAIKGNQFIYYALEKFKENNKWNTYSSGSTFDSITGKNLNNLVLSFPSELERNKIGILLKKLDSILTLYERKYQLYKLLFRELQKNFFFNKVNNFYPLSSLVKIKTGTRNSQDNVSDGKYIFFDRSTEVKKLNEFDFDEEAIIIPGEGTKFVPHYINEKYALHQRTYSLYDFSEKISPKYLYYFLMTQSNNLLRYSVGTTVPSLRIATFNHIKVPVYSKKVQEKCAFVLDSLNNFLIQIKNKENILKELKIFLLQTMFI